MAGENARIDRSRLEDIRFRVRYGDQELFPPGRCN
jgi:hypothetical protein